MIFSNLLSNLGHVHLVQTKSVASQSCMNSAQKESITFEVGHKCESVLMNIDSLKVYP